MMFSSTVIGLKLVPTTTLHQKRTGEIMTGVLLIQDLLAIIIILILSGGKTDEPVVTFFIIISKICISNWRIIHRSKMANNSFIK